MSSKRTPGVKVIMDLVRGFQPSCVVIAAAELDVFTILHARPLTVAQLARRIKGDLRATSVLLDAITAIKLLEKDSGPRPVYRVPPSVADVLTESGSNSMLGMVRHQGNCLRRWDQLGSVVMRGKPAVNRPSIRGSEGDLVSFIRAMHEVSGPMVEPLISSLGPLTFTHLLDLGGASGTWTIPFLQRNPLACATIFDQPDVIPMARRLMKKAGLASRVKLISGNFDTDALPAGADLAWISAIVHQNSRAQNRALFTKVFAALEPGGQIMLRDIVMEASRTRPTGGALFAVNMLVATPGGGTFTFDELRADLSSVGFGKIRLMCRGEWMDSVVGATKPVTPKSNSRPMKSRRTS